jgi:transposase
LISEFGVIAPQSTDALRHIVFEQKNSLPLQVQQCVDDLLEHVARIEDNIAEYDRILSRMAKTDHRSQRLMELRALAPQRPVRWSPVSVMHMILRMGASWQPGWD